VYNLLGLYRLSSKCSNSLCDIPSMYWTAFQGGGGA